LTEHAGKEASMPITLSDKVQMFKFQIPLEWDKDEVKL
jgi:hypothetical protein